ncbi:actin depolymerizing protein [Hyaloraphidium curvatum]|nr:actin depolymerizing protein [Hyaloraphidium curvatum]
MGEVVLDPEIKEAYEAVRSDDDKTDWLLAVYEDGKKDSLKLAGKGTGGLEALKAELKDDACAYGYIGMDVGNDELSIRRKFVLVSWTPANVSVMRRAKVSVHLAGVKKVLSVFSIEAPASTLQDLDYKEIETRVKKSMGANYDGQAR